jgi:hypothetical protein
MKSKTKSKSVLNDHKTQLPAVLKGLRGTVWDQMYLLFLEKITQKYMDENEDINWQAKVGVISAIALQCANVAYATRKESLDNYNKVKSTLKSTTSFGSSKEADLGDEEDE